MKRPLLFTLAALATTAALNGAASAAPSATDDPRMAPAPADAIQPDANEMAAIRKARERCRDAGGPQDQQACMNQAQMEYYRSRDGAKDGAMPPSGPAAPGEPKAQ